MTSSFGVATFPLNGSTPQELIQVADASMYLSKHQGGNAVSTADQFNPDDSKQWKRDVLDAYLGVTLKRLFATGPDAFVEIYSRIEQFARSFAETESSRPRWAGKSTRRSSDRIVLRAAASHRHGYAHVAGAGRRCQGSIHAGPLS